MGCNKLSNITTIEANDGLIMIIKREVLHWQDVISTYLQGRWSSIV